MLGHYTASTTLFVLYFNSCVQYNNIYSNLPDRISHNFSTYLYRQASGAELLLQTYGNVSCECRSLETKYSKTLLIRTLVIRIPTFPDRLGPSDKFVEKFYQTDLP